ncbi:prohead protease/major capsid protein fusion protein [Rhizobium sp. SSA_523]|uniref:prohead protease/major capsid protein fusion protein n=1 Tax=Rhizobium sp. SSA_523 TaxID=2952477 RepID=UPI0020901E05|nr:prohead protease/major capsid protein fusion protein [Rhizobium sp. SSA_523]MCO5730088.1 Mu-like prophage major head subunit gpT family protein [Rhizobium sp. SSA_523]WKC25153.1 Mu-like prophage major head subunit gpT family protein [Rhizobium sp. SSA_523]
MPQALRQALEKEIRIPKSFGEVEVRADTFNEDDRTVEVCWSTGAAVKRYSWDEGYYMEELQVDAKSIRLERFSAMSLLDTHDNYSMESRLGTVVPGSVRFQNGKAYARIKFSRKQRAEEIMQDIRDGHPLPISVGYKIHRYEKTEASDGQLPVLRATDWEPLELSAVPIPADAGAISRSEPDGKDFETVLVRQDTSAASPATTKERPMNKREAAKKYTGDQLDALAIGSGISRSEGETDDALRARLLAAYDKEDREAADAEQARNAADAARRAAEEDAQRRASNQQPQTITPEQAREQARQAVAAEAQRRSDIEAFAATAGLALSDELVRTSLGDTACTMEKFRNAVLDKMVADQGRNPTFPHAETRGMQDAQETMRRMVANAILHRSGIVEKLEDGAREWRGMETMDIVKEILRARGESTRGNLHDIATRGLHSTSDFPIILGDITRQTLMNAYGRYENTFQLFATRMLLSDYRETKVLDIGSAPDLKRKGEHGEFTSGSVRESEEGMKLHAYGRKIGFTREMLINDQLDAFMQLVANWGLKVAKLEGDVVWGAIINNSVKLKDNKPIFDASHNNVAGTGTVLDKANLIKARKAFRKQTDIDGEPIDVTPKYLFTGSDLEVDAQTIIAAAYTPGNVGDVTPQAIKSLIPVYESRLDKIPTSAWFLFADAQSTMGRGIKYLHLLGSEAPRTNERIGFDVEGVEYTIAHDFGVGADDYRFGYKNPGVAPQ